MYSMWSNDQPAVQTSDPAQFQMAQPYQPGAALAVAHQTNQGLQQRMVMQPAPIAAPTPLTEGAFDIPQSFVERIELCKFLADANLLPSALRKQPANVLLIMHKALALNIPLSVALEHMYVLDGKVDHSAELLRGLIHRAGHILRWITISDKEATGELTLKHDPKNTRRVTYTIADATRMKLASKDNWQKDPASMLVARCTTRLVTYHCPEIAVALGNLSAVDEPAEPAEPAAAVEAGPSLEQQAYALFEQAQAASSADDLKAIGQQARQDQLLDVAVDEVGTTLQQTLLARLAALKEAAATAAPAAEATSEPHREAPRRRSSTPQAGEQAQLGEEG